MRKRLYTGLGHFLIDPGSEEPRREIQVSYAIKLITGPQGTSAFGHVSGLDSGSKRMLRLIRTMKLRLQNENVIDVVFLGGGLAKDTARIGVVSPTALTEASGRDQASQ